MEVSNCHCFEDSTSDNVSSDLDLHGNIEQNIPLYSHIAIPFFHCSTSMEDNSDLNLAFNDNFDISVDGMCKDIPNQQCLPNDLLDSPCQADHFFCMRFILLYMYFIHSPQIDCSIVNPTDPLSITPFSLVCDNKCADHPISNDCLFVASSDNAFSPKQNQFHDNVCFSASFNSDNLLELNQDDSFPLLSTMSLKRQFSECGDLCKYRLSQMKRQCSLQSSGPSIDLKNPIRHDLFYGDVFATHHNDCFFVFSKKRLQVSQMEESL